MWKSIDPIQFNGERERAYWMAFVVPSWTWHLLKGCSLGSLWLWLVFINFEWGREQETKFAAWSQLRDKGQRDSLANLALHSNFALYLELQPKLKANLIKFIHGDGGNDKLVYDDGDDHVLWHRSTNDDGQHQFTFEFVRHTSTNRQVLFGRSSSKHFAESDSICLSENPSLLGKCVSSLVEWVSRLLHPIGNNSFGWPMVHFIGLLVIVLAVVVIVPVIMIGVVRQHFGQPYRLWAHRSAIYMATSRVFWSWRWCLFVLDWLDQLGIVWPWLHSIILLLPSRSWLA